MVAVIVASQTQHTWAAPALSSKHDFDNPELDHTKAAMSFEDKGDLASALRAFESAARFQPSASTFANLGVCYMRRGRYHHAAHVMHDAKKYASPNDEHLKENWDALKYHMELAGVPMPELPAIPGWDESTDAEAFREELVHQRYVPKGKSMKRVTIKEVLEDPQLLSLKVPLIISDGANKWKALKTWRSLAHVKKLFGEDTVTDFYPYNLLDQSRQAPYLTRLGLATQELRRVYNKKIREQIPSKFGHDTSAFKGRYLHLQLTPDMWNLAVNSGDIPKDHLFRNADDWMKDCLNDELANEYHLKTHWKVTLMGSKGAGMFNHTDSLKTSSWHAHIRGMKWWYVCGPSTEGCFESYVQPGEILAYGSGWWHETQNVQNPTVTVTGTIINEHNFRDAAEVLHSECSSGMLGFKLSGELCDALDSCYKVWHSRFAGRAKPLHLWPEWRSVSSKENLNEKSLWKPKDSNYDGRNPITE